MPSQGASGMQVSEVGLVSISCGLVSAGWVDDSDMDHLGFSGVDVSLNQGQSREVRHPDKKNRKVRGWWGS